VPADEAVDWWRPANPGDLEAAAARSGMATPLLAGFSITFMGVVAQQDNSFWQPGLSIFLLSIAVAFFVISVQCGFWARMYAFSPTDAATWYPHLEDDPDLLAEVRSRQRRRGAAFTLWNDRAKNSYSGGLLFLFIGLASALIPRATDPQPGWRWAAAAVALAMFAFELYWVFGGQLVHRVQAGGRELGPIRFVMFGRWFTPVTARERRADRRALRHTPKRSGQ
jgi:MFS family permease